MPVLVTVFLFYTLGAAITLIVDVFSLWRVERLGRHVWVERWELLVPAVLWPIFIPSTYRSIAFYVNRILQGKSI